MIRRPGQVECEIGLASDSFDGDFRGSRKPLRGDNACCCLQEPKADQVLPKRKDDEEPRQEPRQGGASELSQIWLAVVIVTLSATSVLTVDERCVLKLP